MSGGSLEVHHVAVRVVDLAQAESFYGGVLGLAVTRRQPHSIWFGLGGGAILMVEQATGGGARADGAPGWHCVALAIARADREAWRARIAVERETAHTLYTRDPEGNLVALSHFPE